MTLLVKLKPQYVNEYSIKKTQNQNKGRQIEHNVHNKNDTATHDLKIHQS